MHHALRRLGWVGSRAERRDLVLRAVRPIKTKAVIEAPKPQHRLAAQVLVPDICPLGPIMLISLHYMLIVVLKLKFTVLGRKHGDE